MLQSGSVGLIYAESINQVNALLNSRRVEKVLAWSVIACLLGGWTLGIVFSFVFLERPWALIMHHGWALVVVLVSALAGSLLFQHREVSRCLERPLGPSERLIGVLEMPRRNATWVVIFWFLATCLALVMTVLAGHWSALGFAQAISGAMVVGVTTALLLSSWQRSQLESTVAELRDRDPGGGTAAYRARYSIRQQIAWTLGGLIFISCAMSLLVSFSQQAELTEHVVGEFARRDLATLSVERILEEGKDACDGPSVRWRSETVFAVIAQGVVRCTRSDAPLEEERLAEIRMLQPGIARTMDGEQVGWVQRVDATTRMVLLESTPQRLMGSLRLALMFFTLLFVFSGAVVVLVSRELAGPVVALTQRARGLTEAPELAGETPRVHISVGMDELGELTVTFERMAVALAQRIATVESLNESLEEKVRVRTRALEESQAQLVHHEKLASLGQLVAGVAHEVNNPLNGIVNSVEPLRERIERLARSSDVGEKDLADVRRLVSIIEDGAGRTAHIVQALRTIGRSDARGKSSVDLRESIRSTVDLLGFRFHDGIALDVQLQDVGRVHCEAAAIHQVLLNLIGNALDAVGSREGARVTLQLLEEGEEEVLVRVIDNGSGIDPQHVSRIFDPFFTTREVGEGMGLGLAISASIIEGHKGRLTVASTSGEGTIMEMHIPRG